MGSRSPVKTLVKMLGLSKMRLCVLFFLISVVTSMPQPQGPEEPLENHPEKYVPQDIEMQMLDEEDMKQLLTDLFVAHPKGPRDARQLEGDADESEAADVADVTDEDAEALDTEEPAAAKDDSEAQASEEEVARVNNYIDAIYRRMNAALRAKMMDPMTLNLMTSRRRPGNPTNQEVWAGERPMMKMRMTMMIKQPLMKMRMKMMIQRSLTKMKFSREPAKLSKRKIKRKEPQLARRTRKTRRRGKRKLPRKRLPRRRSRSLEKRRKKKGRRTRKKLRGV